MANGEAAAAIKARGEKIKAYQEAVFRESAQRTIEIAQTPTSAGGHMRVDTGYLRSSLTVFVGDGEVALTSKPDTPPGAKNLFSYNEALPALVLANAKITDTVSAIYTANYAAPREYGSRGKPGDGFVRLAAQQWPQTVAQVSAEAKERAGL